MEDKMLQLRRQMQQNNLEVGDFLKDLDVWTKDIKKQDASLKSMKPGEKAASVHPPVRSAPVVEKVKKKRESQNAPKQERIRSSDYSKWEKLDVDAMLQEVDEDEKKMEEEVQVEVEKLDEKRKAKVAAEMKQKGNDHFKKAGYQAAIECYTTGMQADPTSPIFPANRAMAYLKLKKYAETEADCTLALSLDPTYTKAYLRRGTARVAVGKLLSARKDFADALKLEPGNGQAMLEIRKLDKLGDLEKVTNKKQPPKPATTVKKKKKGPRLVQPIFIPPMLQSRKPLMRVEVEEIGLEPHEMETDMGVDLDDKFEWKNKEPKARPKTKQRKPAISVVSKHHMHHESSVKICQKFGVSKEIVQEVAPSTSVKRAVDTSAAAHACETGSEGSEVPTIILNSDTEEIPKKKIIIKNDSVNLKTEADVRLNTDLKQLHGSSSADPAPVALSERVTAKIPPHPATSFQFQADVKRLRTSPEQLYLYLKQISPSHIPSLLKQQLETETLMPVVRCLHKHLSGNAVVFDYLQQFAKVRRFDMAIMFLSGQEKKDISSLLCDLEKEFPTRMEDARGLKKRYGL